MVSAAGSEYTPGADQQGLHARAGPTLLPPPFNLQELENPLLLRFEDLRPPFCKKLRTRGRRFIAADGSGEAKADIV